MIQNIEKMTIKDVHQSIIFDILDNWWPSKCYRGEGKWIGQYHQWEFCVATENDAHKDCWHEKLFKTCDEMHSMQNSMLSLILISQKYAHQKDWKEIHQNISNYHLLRVRCVILIFSC